MTMQNRQKSNAKKIYKKNTQCTVYNIHATLYPYIEDIFVE